GAVAELGHLLVQLLADAGDLTLADAFQAQGLHQVVHLPGADAVDVSLLDDGQQGPFGPPAWLQEAGGGSPPAAAAGFAAQWCRPGCPSSGGGTRYGSWCAQRYVHSVRRRPSA